MRFMKMMAALALGFAGQAQAAKIFQLSGTITPDTSGSGSFVVQSVPNFSGGTSFSRGFYLTFSSPVSGDATALGVIKYNIFSKDHVELEGNDYLSGPGAYFTAARSVHAHENLPLFWLRYPGNPGLAYYSQYVFDTNFVIRLNSLSEPVSFNATFFTGVPEPSTWAMMILGFGAIGAAMRRRNGAVLALA